MTDLKNKTLKYLTFVNHVEDIEEIPGDEAGLALFIKDGVLFAKDSSGQVAVIGGGGTSPLIFESHKQVTLTGDNVYENIMDLDDAESFGDLRLEPGSFSVGDAVVMDIYGRLITSNSTVDANYPGDYACVISMKGMDQSETTVNGYGNALPADADLSVHMHLEFVVGSMMSPDAFFLTGYFDLADTSGGLAGGNNVTRVHAWQKVYCVPSVTEGNFAVGGLDYINAQWIFTNNAGGDQSFQHIYSRVMFYKNSRT